MEILIICGHYGSGKTNLSVNIALKAAKKRQVLLIDMDVVNPYFRSSDYTEQLATRGIEVISPVFAGTTVDAPCLSPKISSVFDRDLSDDALCIFDAGGDDAGAVALAQYAPQIQQHGYTMLYVINKYRTLIADENDAFEILKEIESASRLTATGIVNNSHLCDQTTLQTVTDSFEYADKVAQKCALPLVYTAVESKFCEQVSRDDLYPIERIVVPNWYNDKI